MWKRKVNGWWMLSMGWRWRPLAKLQWHHIRPSLKSVDFRKGSPESHWSPESESQSRLIFLADDGMSTISMRSGTSAGTTPSMAFSSFSKESDTDYDSKTCELHTEDRIIASEEFYVESSVTSERTNGRTLSTSISHGHLKAVNLSNISLLRSTGHLPTMDTVL